MHLDTNSNEPTVLIPIREYDRLRGLESTSKKKPEETTNLRKTYVYGLEGMKSLFNCSIATANRIKASGKIDEAITQIGRKIIIDADLAMELAGQKNGGRRK